MRRPKPLAQRQAEQRRVDEVLGLTASSAALDVLRERKRQIAKGWTPDHDDGHTDGWIANAAAEMLLPGQHAIPGTWAWKHKHPDSPERLSRREQLVVGAAMALAEIERFDRQSSAKAA
jgi:hypothetical protein